jgi:hypothetical protein
MINDLTASRTCDQFVFFGGHRQRGVCVRVRVNALTLISEAAQGAAIVSGIGGMGDTFLHRDPSTPDRKNVISSVSWASVPGSALLPRAISPYPEYRSAFFSAYATIWLIVERAIRFSASALYRHPVASNTAIDAL